MGRAGEHFTAVRVDDPRRRELEATGHVVAGESWGAHLTLHGPAGLAAARSAVLRVRATGVEVAELDPGWAARLHELEAANHPDYPFTPATAHRSLDLEATEQLWGAGARVFGATVGSHLVGATVIDLARQDGSAQPCAETRFTSVRAEHRGRGIGTAVKAASVLALAAEGVRSFATGGAGTNGASLAANRALGYVVDERWVSYTRP